MAVLGVLNALCCMAAGNELFTLFSVLFWLLYIIGRTLWRTAKEAEEKRVYESDMAFAYSLTTPKYGYPESRGRR